MHEKSSEAAPGITAPWLVGAVRFDAAAKVSTVDIGLCRRRPTIL
ncbi:MAG: hypothetical protein ACK5RK_06530 [Betaproteobacteria bacterium]